jgi:Icc-related predicted phosphoesterase
MRILLVADLHYALPHFDWIARVAGDHDVVALAGDLLDIVSPVPIEAQIAALQATLRDLAERTQLVVCSGNHDLNTRSPAGEKCSDWLQALRDTGVTVDGDSSMTDDTVITSIGWWDGPVGRAEVDEQLAAVDVAGRRWVWVYHSPPEGPLAWTGSRHFGDPVVADWIERWQPTAVLTGHIHQAPFTDAGSWVDRVGSTWLFNAGKQLGPVPAHVTIDLDGAVASWTGLTGSEQRSLAPG